jgi:hypothetical protein
MAKRMASPKTALLKNKKITLIFLAGAVLLIVGVALWAYTNSVVQAHQQILQNPNLTQQQKWQTEGSLQWWMMTKITVYDPAALILIVTGLVALEYVTLWAIIQPP